MYNRNNAAFNFEVVEEQRKAKVVRIPGKRARKLAHLRSQRLLMLGVFSVFCVCALGVSGFVMGQAELAVLSDRSSQACRNLEQIQSVNTQLSVKLKSVDASDSFQDKNVVPVEIVAVHTQDAAKRR